MLQWRVLGITMIVPTITVAIIITYKTWRERDDEFWINLAICFWISANSYWMICEFFKHEEIKNFAGIPFSLGIMCVVVFYAKRLFGKTKKNITD